MNYPISQAELEHIIFTHHKKEYFYEEETLLRLIQIQRKAMKNMIKTADLLVWGDFSKLESRHIHNFGDQVLKKFRDNDEKIRELYYYIFSCRELFIEKFND